MREPQEQATSASIERQLGEVVGTLRMTVTAVDALKTSVEKLAERAVFKGELDAVRADLRDDISTVRAEVGNLKTDLKAVQRWMWTGGGVLSAVVMALNYFKPFSNILGGG